MVSNRGSGQEPSEAGVLILGGGPAGLCLATHLQQRGVPFRILEKGSPGHSWRRMPPGLSLVSPWKTNWLLPEDAAHYPANAQLTRREYAEYLREFTAANGLRVDSNCEVLAVSQTEQGFAAKTTRGTFHGRMMVSAIGYFSNPFRPAIPGAADTAIPQMHYADYRGPEQITALAPAGSTVLIVGKRLSAGQTLLELHDTGWKTALSHESPIQFGCSDWFWPLAYRNFAWIEELKLKLLSRASAPLDVRMPGGRARRLLASGMVETFPGLKHLDRTSAIFADGRALEVGLILYATGFRPALNHLQSLRLRHCPETGAPICQGFESVDVPGLYFLGLEMLRNFQSRFLRGIRNDAAILAHLIEKRFAALDANTHEPVTA
jgi:hypothetical protein